MTANRVLLWRKYARIIEGYAKLKNIMPREALDVFYKSYTYVEMDEGISDMHCRSDGYLIDEICLEQQTGC